MPPQPSPERELAELERKLLAASDEKDRLEEEFHAYEARLRREAGRDPDGVPGWAASALRSRTRPLRNLLKPLLGIRLQLEPYHAPRPLVTPRRYTRVTSLGSRPLVSIVTPSFNQASFLPRTMSSVLEQGYRDLEYVVQDGGSRDGSVEVLQRFQHRLHHFESHSDRGQANALNLGFARTTGEIMGYLNSDDLLLPGALHYVARYFDAHPHVDVVYGHRVLIDQFDREIGRWILPPHRDEHLLFADYVPQETLFWRRRIWERAGGHVDESFQFAIDWDLLVRFLDAGACMVRLPRFLGAFRVHDRQKTSRQLHRVGAFEMERIRRRYHLEKLTGDDLRRGLLRFFIGHALCRRLYQLGLVRY